MVGTDLLEPREARWLWNAMGVVPSSVDSDRVDSAIERAGLNVDVRLDLSTEWGEWSEEHTGKSSRQLLHAARLVRQSTRYVGQFGQQAYDMMLGDCLWHVYGMIGKLNRRVYVLSRP